jgi:magnesium chelatase family protein
MTFPSQFMLVAAMNPTPDGKMPGESRCSPREIQNYLNRISGPLLDRIDIHVEVPAVKFREITAERTGETSTQIRERVVASRRRQQERFAGKRNVTCNARMGSHSVSFTRPTVVGLTRPSNTRTRRGSSTATSSPRILKVARTIADLAGSERLTSEHISEAIQYRSLDRQLWA